MKRLSAVLFASLFIVAVVSCSKDNPQYEEAKDAFLFGGVKYSTLQDAINAAVALDDDDSTVEHYIQLMKNTSGPGASISESFNETVIFDLGQFDYEVSGGGSISVCNANLLLTGNGGRLFNSNKSMPLISAKDGNIYIDKNIVLDAKGEVVKTNANVFVEKNFTGRITGDVSIIQEEPQLEGYYSFEYLSSNGTMDIGNLILRGDRATFDVRAKLGRSGAISVGNLQADSQNALRAVDNESVKLGKGGSVHVHEWVMAEHRDKTCYSEEEIEWHCTDCDDYFVEVIDNDAVAACPASSLIHHPAASATEFEWGNIEFWECPFCGTLYADAAARTKLQSNPFIEPFYETDDEKWEINYDQGPVTKGASWDALCNAGSIVGMFYSIGCYIWQKVDDPKQFAKIQRIDDGVKDLMKTLGDVGANLKLNMEKLACQEVLYERWGMVNNLKAAAAPAWDAVLTTMGNTEQTSAAKRQTLVNVLSKWHKENKDFYEDLINCLQNYYSGEMQFKSIPLFAEQFQNNKQKWEHLGYGWRTNFNAVDLSKILECCSVELLYQELVNAPTDSVLANKSIKQINDDLSLYYKEYQRDSVRMATRNEKYRVLVTGKYNQAFEREAKNVDIRGWFSQHRDRKLDFNLKLKEYPPQYRSTLDQLVKDLDMENLMDEDVANVACDGGKGHRYNTLSQVGFTNFAGSNKTNLLLLGKNSGDWCDLSNWFNRIIRSRYRFFYWENRTVRSGKDLVRVENVLSDSASGLTESLDIMTNAKFVCKKTKDNGTIKDMGTYSNKLPLKIIKKVKAEEKAEAYK